MGITPSTSLPATGRGRSAVRAWVCLWTWSDPFDILCIFFKPSHRLDAGRRMMIPDMDGAELSTLPAKHVLREVDHSEAVAPPVNKAARNDDFHDGRYGISMSRRHETQNLKEGTRQSSPNFPIFDPCRIEGDESVCVVWQEGASKAGQGGIG